MADVNLAAFERDLTARVRGRVSFERTTRLLYATDASMYQIPPVAVAVPLDEDDLRAAVAVAAEHGVPILPRGGGTSLAGQCIAAALVLDCSKHLNQLLEVNAEERWARVQPGLVRDELNALLAPTGLHFAPDPATGNRATVGGMVANNASGTRSLIYGMTIDHLLEVRVLLPDGTELTCAPRAAEDYAARAAAPGREGEVLTGVRAVIDANRDEIAARYPKIQRRANGYLLDEVAATDPPNLAKLICGSEGTLATILEAKLDLTPVPKATALVMVHFGDLLESVRSVEPILAHHPAAVELLDRILLDLARQNVETARQCTFLEGTPEAVLAVEVHGQDPDEARVRAEELAAALGDEGIGYARPVLADQVSQANVWAVRKAGLGLMLAIQGDAKPQAFIEDAALPLPKLGDYIDHVLRTCEQHDVRVCMYAHASVGLIHVRPILNLKSRHDIDTMKAIAESCFQRVVEYGGSWSGEHGDGLVRSAFLPRFFGPKLYGAFRELKHLFDPSGLMNPGKIIDAPPMDDNLRYGTEYRATPPVTLFHHRRDGGFAAAVETCNGVGACRKTLVGTMCPSYIATRDEEHSTRARANALRLAISGQLGPQGMAEPRVHEVLDLCLSCKGCKAECPSSVDMARLKSDALQVYHDHHGLTLRDRIIGATPELARLAAGPLAPVINAVQRSAPVRALLQKVCGFDARRVAPAYAKQTFTRWFDRRGSRLSAPDRRVVLFEDTWLNFHEPGLGSSAVELLESCGYEVLLARAGCCQRPRISHGLLREAKRRGERTLRNLDKFFIEGLPVVVCEPSCASSLADDLPDLIDDEALAERAKAGVHMIDVFLARELEAGRIAGAFEARVESILLHGHCHQKALWGTKPMRQLWGRADGLAVKEVDSGCCGMAGSFGYEREHYDLSTQVAEDRLLPTIRAAEEGTTVVACGFSCRHQLKDLAGVKAVHFVETVRGTGAKA